MEHLDRAFHAKMIEEYKHAKEIMNTLPAEYEVIKQAKQGSTTAARLLFNLNYPLLIKYINVTSFPVFTGSIADLIAEAYKGLKRAIEKFDFKSGFHFSAVFIPYALSRAREAVKADKLVYVPDTATAKDIKIQISSLNTYISTCESDVIDEKINYIFDKNNVETDLKEKLLLEDADRVLNAVAEDKDKYISKKLVKFYVNNDFGNNKVNDKNITSELIKKQFGVSKETFRKIRHKFNTLRKKKGIEL